MSGCSRANLPTIEVFGHNPADTGYMSGQCCKVLKVSERFYEGLFFYRHPKVLLKPQSVSQSAPDTPNRSTPNVAVDRNAPAAR